MNHPGKDLATRLPAVTLGFWIIKIPASTVASTTAGTTLADFATR